MARAKDHPSLCRHHAQQAQQAQEAQAVAADLLGPLEEFTSIAAVNLFLGNLLILHAQGRVSHRHATTLAYISQLLLFSVPPLQKELRYEEYLRTACIRPEPLPATPAAFADAVFRRVLADKPGTANVAPSGLPQPPNETESAPRNRIE